MALFIERFDVDARTMTVVNIDGIKSVDGPSSGHGRVLQSENLGWSIPTVLGFSDRLAYCVAQGVDLEPDDAVARPVAALIKARKGCHSSGASEERMLAYLEQWLTKEEIKVAKSIADWNVKYAEITGLKTGSMISLAQSLELDHRGEELLQGAPDEVKANDNLIPERKPADSKRFGRRG